MRVKIEIGYTSVFEGSIETGNAVENNLLLSQIFTTLGESYLGKTEEGQKGNNADEK